MEIINKILGVSLIFILLTALINHGTVIIGVKYSNWRVAKMSQLPLQKFTRIVDRLVTCALVAILSVVWVANVKSLSEHVSHHSEDIENNFWLYAALNFCMYCTLMIMSVFTFVCTRIRDQKQSMILTYECGRIVLFGGSVVFMICGIITFILYELPLLI